MKICLFIVCLGGTMIQHVLAQKNIPNFDHTLLLESISDTTANVSLADFDGDGHLDILLVKGRHWPIIDRVLLGDGRGGIRRAYDLGTIADRSYTGGVADFNGDGFPDIAVSNDNPDRKLVYFNDGKGKFTVGSEFGRPEWPTRNLAIADINGDGFPDLILANRGDLGNTSNYICLNNGKGQFDSTCIAFAPYPATTIYPVDINKDGFIDLVVPHRDGGQSYVYLGSADGTYTDAHRIPFGPSNATIRMAAAADLNGDGLTDIVTIDEHKGVDLYLGQKNHTFSAGISLADSKIVPYALTIADLNNDKKMDIIVGHIEAPSTVFFNDGKGRFKSISFGDTTGTVYGFAVGDFNEDGIPDIAAARSEGPNVLYFGSNNSTTEYFGQDPPGETPEIFAPGFISKPDRYELMTAYAPDGKEFCFTVTNEHWSHFEIRHTLFDGGKWTEPQKMPFANSMECFGPAFSPDNTGMFFSSANWVTHPATIWYSARLGDGWDDPVRSDSIVNAGADQWQSSIAKDGTLVFAARRVDGKGGYDLYLSEPVHHHYNKVSNLVDLNSPADEYSAFIAADKSYIIFSSQRSGGYGWDDLYISFRKQEGWTDPVNLGPAINTVNAEFSPQVTPDGHFLIYSKWDVKNKWSDIYWVRIDKTIDSLKVLSTNAAIGQLPIRDPHTPGYVSAKELPDGTGPSPDSNGNFIIGPTHDPAPEASVQANVPQGTVYHFTMDSKDSKIYPGIAREPNTFGVPDPADPAKLVVTTSHPASYTRQVAVYVPKQYVAGTAAPFIVGADGPDNLLFTVLDNLIAEGKVPPMIAISIGNGSGDAQGSERGMEYDAMNGVYAEFVEKEVLPLVESKCHVKLTKDPAGRATMGGSSGGSCALIMAWYHPELYHRVLTYSGTYINQQWPFDPKTPHGAWEFHEHLIPESPVKPLRIWMEVGDQDLYNPNVMRDGMHDWVVANENMARVLAAKGYPYQFVFARNARHVDRNVRKQTLPEALEWLWKDYRPVKVAR